MRLALLVALRNARAEAKQEKLAPAELWTVELALDLAGWKPALLEHRETANQGL